MYLIIGAFVTYGTVWIHNQSSIVLRYVISLMIQLFCPFTVRIYPIISANHSTMVRGFCNLCSPSAEPMSIATSTNDFNAGCPVLYIVYIVHVIHYNDYHV